MAGVWLLVDVGGTHTRVGLSGPDGSLHPDTVRTFHNAEHAGLAEVLGGYLSDTRPGAVQALCAGVAGPVRGEQAQLTNLDWHIDSATLARITGTQHIMLLNDLQVQGYALDDLDADETVPLFQGAAAARGATRLVMGIGTGSNVAVVHDTPMGLLVPPAESGHASLPYAEGKLAELVEYLGKVQSHRPMESALSGPGLSSIYHFLTTMQRTPEDILAAYHAGESAAHNALAMFCQLLGQVTGDLALAHLPMGGVYFIGGMARAVAPLLQNLGFHDRFCAKGPYAPILQDIPVSLITNDRAALLGCARYLRQSMSV